MSQQVGTVASLALRVMPNPRRAKALARAYRRPRRVVLLVTDLAGFSRLITTLGDRMAQELIHVHNELLRTCLRQHAGREVTHTGDGIIAAFSDAAAAARCAVQIQAQLHEFRELVPHAPLSMRIGLHAGRPLPEEGGRLFGASVNFAVRVCAVAQPNEILVSDCVQKLLKAGFDCCEQEPTALKGFEGTYRLHSVAWQSPSLHTN
ncbi:MAG: adenylate/guanylate cyclase domain-containing protein [Polyangiales bacterium]